MKKLFIAFLCMLTAILSACGQTAPPEETTTITTTLEGTTQMTTHRTSEALTSTVIVASSEITPYSDAINAYHSGNFIYSNADHYALYDIDSNGTQELLLSWQLDGHFYLATVYAIKDGTAVRQEGIFAQDVGSEAPALLFKNGTICLGLNDEGDLFYYYYRFEDSELKFQTMIKDEWRGYYRTNDIYKSTNPITKEEFDRVKTEMEGNGQVVELDWKPLAEFGR